LLALVLGLALQRGIGLGLFHEDPDFSYAPMLREIAQTGADHVSIVVPWDQHDVRSTRIAPHARLTAPDATLLRTLADAKAAGLRVFLEPILRLEYAATIADWRGSIVPGDHAAWWESYRAFVLHYARLAERAGNVDVFAIGSELGSMDGERDAPRWAALARDVRAVFHGLPQPTRRGVKLLYSANWDRFAHVALWSQIDLAGLSAYFELARPGDRDPDVASLVRAWREFRGETLRSAKRIGKPLVITEVGYLSQDGTAGQPWNEGAQERLDLEEQRRCYEAFARVWSDAPELAGVYFWNWYGWGGPRSREYTPRGKPAAREICRFFGSTTCPTAYGDAWAR
jgi:hypothetical protein